MTSFCVQVATKQQQRVKAKERNVWKSTQTLQHMHALSTQRKANKVNGVNGFPIEGSEERTGVHGALAPFSTYSWQNGTLMTINPECMSVKPMCEI